MQQGDRFAIGVPALVELLYGIQVIPRSRQNVVEWEQLRSIFLFYHIDQTDAEQAATLQVTLRQRGHQLQTVDALIAAVALRYGLTLLTTDRDFLAVTGLVQENWLMG